MSSKPHPPVKPRTAPETKSADLLADKAYHAIKLDVITTGIAPGSTLTENEVADRYRLGRAAARAALQRLCQERLASVAPRRGYRIATLTLRDLDEVCAMRAWLEPAATRLAVGRVDVALLRRLEATNKTSITAGRVDSRRAAREGNQAFHEAIAVAAGNVRLRHALAAVYDDLARYIHLCLALNPQSMADMVDEHEALIEAIADGDVDAAEKAAREHVETAHEAIANAMRRSPAVMDAPIGVSV